MKQIKKHRTYCKTCQDFTIHSAEYNCEVCDTKFTSYFVSEVDESKLELQRERYLKRRSQKWGGLYGAFLRGNGIQAMMDMGEVVYDLTECDAGQKEIEEERKQIRQQRKKQLDEIKEEYSLFYAKTNRNDLCPCGSNLKFKKCHLNHFRKYLVI